MRTNDILILAGLGALAYFLFFRSQGGYSPYQTATGLPVGFRPGMLPQTREDFLVDNAAQNVAHFVSDVNQLF